MSEREKSCTTKRVYETLALARRIAAKRNAVKDDGRSPLSAYKCHFERHYHIGHTIRRVAEAKGVS